MTFCHYILILMLHFSYSNMLFFWQYHLILTTLELKEQIKLKKEVRKISTGKSKWNPKNILSIIRFREENIPWVQDVNEDLT